MPTIRLALAGLLWSPALALGQAGITRWVDVPLLENGPAAVFTSTPEGRTGCSFTSFAIVWAIPTSQVVTPEQDHDLLDNYIVPAMKTKCPAMPMYELYHLVKGTPLLDEAGREIAFSGRSYVRSGDRWVSMSATGRARYQFPSWDAARAGIAEAKRSVDDSRRSGEKAQADALAAETAARERKCAVESVGGAQPCGAQLARAFVEVAREILSPCPKVLDHAWCTIDFGRTWVRWMGGTQLGCRGTGETGALLCDFSVDWECKVRNMQTNEEITTPAVVGPLCATFGPNRLSAKATGAGGAWRIELVRRGGP